jgi:DnaJ-class molecular chaperone
MAYYLSNYTTWQTCPDCNGTGWVKGDSNSSAAGHMCFRCGGTGNIQVIESKKRYCPYCGHELEESED